MIFNFFDEPLPSLGWESVKTDKKKKANAKMKFWKFIHTQDTIVPALYFFAKSTELSNS